MNASENYDGVIFSVARSPVLDINFFKSRGIKDGKLFLFLGDIESNDIGYALTQGKTIEEVQTYVPLITRAQIRVARELIRMGATRLIIPGNAPLGCFPYILTALRSNNSGDYDELGCLKSVNDLIVSKNDGLQQAIRNLNLEFPNIIINYGAIYDGTLEVIRDASHGPNGELALQACCGTGGKYNYDGKRFCGSHKCRAQVEETKHLVHDDPDMLMDLIKVSWNRPKDNWYKLNVDVALRTAELESILYGIEFAWNRGFHKIEIESDCWEAVDGIKTGSHTHRLAVKWKCWASCGGAQKWWCEELGRIIEAGPLEMEGRRSVSWRWGLLKRAARIGQRNMQESAAESGIDSMFSVGQESWSDGYVARNAPGCALLDQSARADFI
ncbi:hypothetical protein BUALT_Bualt12G0137800 [Buddleja alternifolia]|uniref:RNase H type-1 domain-containing protein n=1 Tax=Buddleja alternifolia TaxID=168488 RepID=A0AAV6WRP0_9LAMI|nr:hypothetical protein BUALT_Bualt12G0137800 [Buddleja alternifolia]